MLDARALYPDSSLADLYDPLSMPASLRKAHQQLDAAVDRAYQLSGGAKTYASDAARVAFLFVVYQHYAQPGQMQPAEQPDTHPIDSPSPPAPHALIQWLAGQA